MENRIINKDRIFMRLMNREACEEIRNSYPCDDFLNLTVGYRWLDYKEDGIRTSVPLKNEELEAAGVEKEELFMLAQKNTENLFDARLYRLGDLVKRICEGEEAKDFMPGSDVLDKKELYVCTNDSGFFGAAVMLIDNVIDNVAKRLGGSIYILPSSVHEIIIVPRIEEYDLNMLKETVHSVNTTVVNETDYLSDNVYLYSTATKKLEIAA